MTRVINRRLRRALEHRDRTCAVPGCDATRGLHAHHIRHWEDGGGGRVGGRASDPGFSGRPSLSVMVRLCAGPVMVMMPRWCDRW
ncbi:hypothetical protein A5672_26475 [Mycobacterium alsense]|uniref:HNH endonuclease n=1 Tax=Mycobacterium alsense TaxID=324058 RepID=A0ABD6NW77_9MYCO|nr:hypothetical protein A5672_26475 [Mycobacterium alsense]